MTTLAAHRSKRAFQSNLSRVSEPRKTRTSGMVTSVVTDVNGLLTRVNVSTGGAQLSVGVPFGMSVYEGMTVSLTNNGTPSNAKWQISGTAMPVGITGGTITNPSGAITQIFDSIWVRNDGYVMIGGDIDLDGNPAGPRIVGTQCGWIGYDNYEQVSMAIYTSYCDGRNPGDQILGRGNGARVEILPQDGTLSMYNENGSQVFSFGSDGNFVRDPLVIGNPLGARINIGEIDDKATFVLRDSNGVAKLVARTDDNNDVYVHIGNPPPQHNSMSFDSGTGRLHVDGNFALDQAEIYGKLTIAGGGTLEFVDESDPLRKGIITRRGIAGYSVDALGQQYLSSVDAWGPLVLENRPGSGNWKTWLAGEMMRGDPDYRNFRVTRGPTGKVGLFNGDEPLIYITHEGGTIYAGAGKIAGWDIQAEALISPSGNIRLDTEYGIVFRILDVTEGGIEEELEGVENTSVFRAISFIENDISAPIHRIYGMRRTVATGIEADSIVVQSRTEETDNRGEAWFSSISAKEARTVISAVGAYGITGKQQTTRLQLWADRGDGTGNPFAYRRIDAETDVLYLTPYTEAAEPAGNKPAGLMLYTTAAGGAWDPGLGAGLYLRIGSAWRKVTTEALP